MAETTTEQPTEVEAPATSRGRRVAIWSLIVVGLVLALVGAVAIYVERLALETDNYVETTTQVLESQEVQVVLSEFIVEELYANVDVEGELRARLPEDQKRLAGPLAGGLRQLAVRTADQALDSPRVQELWSNAQRRTHEQVLLLLDDESELVTRTGGAVFVDLRPAVIQVGDRVGIGERLDMRLPPDAGRLVIVEEGELETVQKLVRFLRFVANWFWVLALACWAAAIGLSRGRRRQTLKGIGIAVFLLGVLVLLVRRVGENVVLNGLVQTESAEPAAEDVWTIVTRDLRDIGQTIVILGLAATLGAWFAGTGRRAAALRRWLAPYLRDRWDLVYGSVLTVFLLLILWAPTGAFRRPLSLAVMAGLLLIGTEALRRQAAREFPDAEPVPLRFLRSADGTADVSGESQASRLAELERLASLRDTGVLTEEEFASQKAAILAER